MALSSDTPAWLRAFVDRTATWLGLDHLTLYYRLKPLGKRARGGGGGGRCRPNWRYNFAQITLDLAITPDAEGYETVTHELLHASLLPEERAVARIIDLVPADLRRHAETLWRDGNEEAVTRLGHHLAPLLRAQMDDKEQKHGRQAEQGDALRPAPDAEQGAGTARAETEAGGAGEEGEVNAN